MKTLLYDYKQLWVAILANAVLFFISMGDTLAHTPHDVIAILEVSPFYHVDKTLFVVIQGRLQKSTDGGHSWKQLSRGLDNKHAISSIAVSPTFYSDATLYLSTDGDGIYKSTDAGLSWRKINTSLDHLKIRFLAISPTYSSDRILLAAGTEGGLYRTKDGGEIWHEVVEASVKITAMDFHPVMDDKYLVIGNERGTISLSTDYGNTWKQQFRLRNGDAITCIAISPNFLSDSTIFIGTKMSGVIKKVVVTRPNVIADNDISEMNLQLREPITSLSISPYYSVDSIIFASTWYTGIFRSDDKGKTWKKSSHGLTSDPQADTPRFKSPHFSTLRISRSFSKDSTIFLGGYDGLFRSTDAGIIWIQVETLSENLISALALSPTYSLDSTIGIVTFLRGLYLSKDDGITWEHINYGLHHNRLLDLTFSPNFLADDAIFTISNSSFYKSTVREKSWERFKLGYHGWRRSLGAALGRLGLPQTFLLRESEKELTFPLMIVPSPEFRSDHTIYFGTRYQGIFKSSNSGQDWSNSFAVRRHWITALVISPDYKSDKTLYAGVSQEGIYKTINGGKTWELIYQEDSPNILLAISQHYHDDGLLLTVTRQGIFKTNDKGKSWNKLDIDNNSGNLPYQTLALSKGYDGSEVIITSVKGGGIFRIDNTSKYMSELCPNILYNNYAIKRIVLSPSFDVDRIIYFVSDEGIFRSVNGGETCELVKTPQMS